MNIFAKLPKFPRFKKGKPRKMRATVARRPLRATTANYEELDEPNMRLSRALLIVLLLHVVAVSGIIAFNAIKTRQGPPLPRSKSSSVVTTSKPDVSGDAKSGEVRPAQSVGDGGGKESGHHAESHKTYVVAKGDNPVAIAKKFKVSYDELLALNHIDDPRKLKIGQKLLIPNKSGKGKKGEH